MISGPVCGEMIIVHDNIELPRNGIAPCLGRNEFETDARIGGERLFEKQIPFGDEQYSDRAGWGKHRACRIIERERVFDIELRCKPTASARARPWDTWKNLHDFFTSGERDRLNVEQLVIVAQFEICRDRVGSEIVDLDEEFARLWACRKRPGGETRDPGIFARTADGEILDAAVDRRITDGNDPLLSRSRRQKLTCELQGRRRVASGVRDRDALNCLTERAFITGKRRRYEWLRSKSQDGEIARHISIPNRRLR